MRNMRIRPLALLLLGELLFIASPAVGQSGDSPSVLDDPVVQYQTKKGLDHLYNMEFGEARAMFEMIDQAHPNHPVGPFLLALNTWWEILIDMSDESHDDEFYGSMEEVIERSDRLLKRDSKNFDAQFFKGAALGFRGRLRSNRGDWFRAAKDGLRAMDFVLGIAERRPENADFAFGEGIYDYYAAAVPEKYPYVKPAMIFFPNGNKQRGIQKLERTVQHGTFISSEAAYFLLQIFYLFERDFEKSKYYATWLRKHHPRNSYFHAFEGRVYAKWGQWDTVQSIYADILNRYKDRQTGYNAAIAEQALYYLARTRMAYGDYDRALTYLDNLKALGARDNEQSYFEVLGRLREGMVLDALGNRGDAVVVYREVLTMKDWSGAHDRAKQFLDRPYSG